MKKLLCLFAFTLLFTACKKEKPAPVQTLKDKISGKWNIISVTTMIRDSTTDSLFVRTYPEPEGYYFKFNADGTWLENLDPSNSNDLSISGNYTVDSDSTFTLYNPANNGYTACKVSGITTSQFIFTHKRNTVINGYDPGSIKYIFMLSR
jgi:hypothetical protein